MRLRNAVLVLCALAGTLILSSRAARSFEPSGLLEIHYINVQQAGATLVIGPGLVDPVLVLLDAGKGDDTIPDYLASIGLDPATDAFDYTFASHLDSDHIRGFKKVFGDLSVGYDVSGGNYYNGSTKTNTTITAYKTAMGQTTAGAPVAVPVGSWIPLEPGATLSNGGATLEVVAVDGAILGGGTVSVSNENDRSIAVLIHYGSFDYMWGADLGGGSDSACSNRGSVGQKDVESKICEALMPGGAAPRLADGLGVDVLHVNHHGSETSTNSTWMNDLRPEVAVIAVGSNGDGNPDTLVVDQILRGGAGECVTAPPALVLQTDEGDDLATTSQTGYVVGDIVIATDGLFYGVDATGRVLNGSPELGDAGLPAFVLADDAAPECPMEVVLSDLVIHSEWIWKAKHSISNDGEVRIASGGDVTLRAGTRVALGDGFAIESGGAFRVEIDPLTDCSETPGSASAPSWIAPWLE